MARITVEDCLKVVPNRFELVLTATKRARQSGHGASAPQDNRGQMATFVSFCCLG